MNRLPGKYLNLWDGDKKAFIEKIKIFYPNLKAETRQRYYRFIKLYPFNDFSDAVKPDHSKIITAMDMKRFNKKFTKDVLLNRYGFGDNELKWLKLNNIDIVL